MSNDTPRPWEQQLRDAATRAEEELRHIATYINDEVVPDIRRNGTEALRAAASELQKLAQRIDERRAAAAKPPSGNDKPPAKGKPAA